MAGYVPYFGKKRERLAEHESEFVALLNQNAEPKVVADAAKLVRSAQIQALKAKRSVFPPSEKNAPPIGELDRQIEQWQAYSIDAIIERYRKANRRGARRVAAGRDTFVDIPRNANG